VVEILGLDIPAGTSIYIGASNIAHMSKEHAIEYNRYFRKISDILANPDYVRVKEDDGSVEYIKEYGKYLKVAVRIAGDGAYYARTLYFIETNRIENLLKKGKLKRLTKK
jgi:hypothetical protein